MSLSPGIRLGPYEVVAPLGAGGMGEVYRARDTRLGREVAIKVLPERLAHDPDALARFEREARAVAALSHPNLLALHDVGRQDQTAYAVMELLEGESLRARLLAGALPVRRALEYGVQIAQGLAAAHEKGIVHRDLKPENLFLTSDGRVKILDFGLAAQRPPIGASIQSSPTQTRHTDPGQVLGTVGYMSPDQVRGQTADARSDVFSFGVVLFEMLSGRRPFHKETAAETMTAILREEPPDLVAGRDDIPAAVGQIVYHCLEKDPAARVNSARDLAFDLQLVAGLSSGRASQAAELRWVRAGRSRWAWAAGGALAGALTVGLALATLKPRAIGEAPLVARLSINLPETLALDVGGAPQGNRALALSPDGRRLVYRAHSGFLGNARLYLRNLSEAEAKPIEGTETATGPFFSPDGHWLVFFDSRDSQFKKVPLAGGTARTIFKSVAAPSGGSWGEDGRIVFAPSLNSGLVRVSSEGGTPEPLTTLDDKTETSHRFPQVLPGGKAVLFTVEPPGQPWDDARIVVQELKTRRRSVVVEGGTGAAYAPSGHILYGRSSNLMAVPFDLDHLKTAGPSVTLIEGISVNAGRGVVHFDVSEEGTLAYISGGGRSWERTLVWVDRRGAVTPATTTGALYSSVSLSPDRRRVAAEIMAADNDVWLLDLANGALTRRTFDHENGLPLWTPDGRRLIFRSDREGPTNLLRSRRKGRAARSG